MDSKESEIEGIVLGKVIVAHRKREGVSQAALAKHLGIAQSTMSRIERGEVQPDFSTFRRLAWAFQMEPADLSQQLERVLQQTKNTVVATAGRTGATANSEEASWWGPALAAAGLVGVAGLIGYAVAQALSDEDEQRLP